MQGQPYGTHQFQAFKEEGDHPGLSYFMLFLRAFSPVPPQNFFIWDSISEQIILKHEWLHFQLLKQQPAHFTKQ